MEPAGYLQLAPVVVAGALGKSQHHQNVRGATEGGRAAGVLAYLSTAFALVPQHAHGRPCRCYLVNGPHGLQGGAGVVLVFSAEIRPLVQSVHDHQAGAHL